MQYQAMLSSLLDLLFPPNCPGCKRRGSILCASCSERIRPLPAPRCTICHGPVSNSQICSTCQQHPPIFSGLRAASLYEEPLRSCIHAFKYEGNTRLAEPLGQVLAWTYRSLRMSADSIVPVPLHPERQRQRGYNHAILLARVCAHLLTIPVREDILIRQRATPPQVGMHIKARQQNMQDAFCCTPEIARRGLARGRMLLLDDVCTTGATLEACARPLLAAGAASVWALVLARPGVGLSGSAVKEHPADML